MIIGGKYQVIRLLGKGGMGAVYEAENMWTARRVAVKIVRQDLAGYDQVVQRFLQEGRSATRVSHPNIVEILDMGKDQESGCLFMVQEFLSGVSLAQLVHRKGHLALMEAADLLVPVMGALVAAHSRDVIHRDVKPDNIILCATVPGEVCPKLIDFGLSKVLVEQPDGRRATLPGVLMGTPAYMSPEQIRVGNEADARTDIWALGVVFFESLSGRRPFESTSVTDLVRKICSETPPRLEQLVPGVPVDIGDVVHRALERDLDSRYGTMREFLDSLLDCPSLHNDQPGASLAWRHRRSIPYERRHPRYIVDWEVALRCPDWAQAQRLVAANVSRGGVFVITSTPPAIGALVELHLSLPDGAVLPLLGTVKHVVSPQQALDGRKPGVGIKFDSRHDVDLLLLEQKAAINLEPAFLAIQDISQIGAATPASQPVPSEHPTAELDVQSSARFATPQGQIADAVGIDFGTSYCSVSVAVGDRVYLIADERQQTLQPTIVSYPGRGAAVIGWEAREWLVRDPRRVISSIKRVLGRRCDDPHIAGFLNRLPQRIIEGPNGIPLFEIEGSQLAPVQVAATVLEHLMRLAQRQTGSAISKAVLSVPVGFEAEQRAALQRAAQIAGLEVLGLLEEPVAGALSYGFDRADDELVAVYDFGGGTFDFSVVQVGRSGHHVLATAGDPWLGGDDLDLALAHAVADDFWRQTSIDLRNRAVEWRRLIFACEQAKRALSTRDEVEITLSDVAEHPRRTDLNQAINRSRFEELCREPVQRSIDLCQEVLAAAELKPSDIQRLVVTGGVSRMPFIRRELASFFEREVTSVVKPDEAVCLGTGLHAAVLSHHAVAGPARPGAG